MSKSSYYHLTGSDYYFDEIDTCIYLDGTHQIKSMKLISEVSLGLFHLFGYKISQIVVSEFSKSKSYVRNFNWLSDFDGEPIEEKYSNLKTLQFFPTKRKTVNETWRPEIYLAITFGYKTNSLYFSFRNCKNREMIIYAFNEMSKLTDFCAGYIYDFPSKLSSMAYYWGIVVDPSGTPQHRFGQREALRLEVWRDNAEIGIIHSDGRKFFNVCDGYVRDVYPTLILSECHSRRKVNGLSLIKFITESFPVSSKHLDGKVWLRIQNDHLLKIQQSFDENQLSLSGRRIVHEVFRS